MLGMLIARGGGEVLFAILAASLAGLALVARARPALATAVAIGVMALPYTWAPVLPKIGAGFGVVVGLLLLLAFVPGLSGFPVNAIDLAVVAFAITPAPIAILQGEPLHLTQWLAPAILLPYFGFRVLLYDARARAAFAPCVIAAGVVVALLGLWETIRGRNPLVAAAVPRYTDAGYVTTWNVPLHRDGHLRAEATFGHPIAFGMFLVIPLAFALVRPARRYQFASALLLASCAVTYSRGPWLAAVVVVVLTVGWYWRRAALIALAVGAAAVLLDPIRRVILESGQATTEPGQTAWYRLGLLNRALDHATLVGHPFADFQTSIANFPDVTSLLAATIVQTGALGALELLVIAWLAVRVLPKARRRGKPDDYAAAVALVASLFGLLTVTLITNYQFFFWALLAYVAHVSQPVERANPRPYPVPET
jgi:hypothetical protein